MTAQDLEDADYVKVTFHPQEWVTRGTDEYAVNASNRDPASYHVPIDDARGEDGTLPGSDTYASDELRYHENAPKWVRNWSGPFYIAIDELVSGDIDYSIPERENVNITLRGSLTVDIHEDETLEEAVQRELLEDMSESRTESFFKHAVVEDITSAGPN